MGTSSIAEFVAGRGQEVVADTKLRLQESLKLFHLGCEQQESPSKLSSFHPFGKGNFYLFPKLRSSLLVSALDLCRNHGCFEKSDFFYLELC